MRKAIAIVIVGLACLITISPGKQKQYFAPGASGVVQPVKPASAKLEAGFGRMPIYFIANQGQMDERVAFYVQGKEKTIYFTEGGVTFVFSRREPERIGGMTEDMKHAPLVAEDRRADQHVVKLDFVGANPDVRPTPENKTEAVISYFKGDPEDWHTGLPTYGRLVYRNLWPGIDLTYSGSVDKLKYEFVVRPGADPSRIKLAYRGASEVVMGEGGRLEVRTPLGSLRDDEPVAFQEKGGGGRRTEIPMNFVLQEADREDTAPARQERISEPGSRTVSFQVGDYDRSLPLILDPAFLVYCGFVGGTGEDLGRGIDTTGCAYITGRTDSPDATFPDTVGPDLVPNGNSDAFVAKIRSDGSGLVYCGYLGGDLDDEGFGIAVDDSGNAYVTGSTYSTAATFPEKVGPDLIHNGGEDAFIAKVNPAGNGLVYCGYIGGSGDDRGFGIALDGSDHAYVTGYTDSSEATFPETFGPDLSYNGQGDAFVAKVSLSGNGLIYCGYIGGSIWDYGRGIAVDGSDSAYVTGNTYSPAATFPEKVGPDLTHNGNVDAFVAKINSSGNGLVYCGYIGGVGPDFANAIALDGTGHAYITGYTFSNQETFPVIVGPDLTKNGSEEDAFVAKVNAEGTVLIYCGYIGGSELDYGMGIAVDGSDAAYVTGYTYSSETSFPEKLGPDLSYNGMTDVFVAKVNRLGNGLIYCGYIGGSGADYGRGIAVDSSGNVYVTGYTESTAATFPEIAGPDLTHNGFEDAFVAKISFVLDPPGIGLSRRTMNFGAVAGGVSTGSQSVLVSNAGEDTLDWTASSDKGWLKVAPASGTNAGILQVSVNPAGLAAGTQTGKITVSDPQASNSPQLITVSLTVLAAGTNGVPFGEFATPINGTGGVTGAIPVTGWVIDDIEVVKVEILRDNFAGEMAGQWAVGDAVFVEGARPDIETACPTYPLNYRAGWGYMLLTNMLPGQGNGAVKLYAYATDKEGRRILLGTKTITCDNAHATKPFGTIDTPAQGGEASGGAFLNWGWVLTPLNKTVPKNGSTIEVYVDGVSVGDLLTEPNFYDQYRADVSGAFPGLKNTGAPGAGGPVGAAYLDTMQYANGVHTIQWVARDDAGAADGIGSRYFSIFNAGTASPAQFGAHAIHPARDDSYESAMNIPVGFEPGKARRGFEPRAEPETIQPDNYGTMHIEMREVERLEVLFDVDNPPLPPFTKGAKEKSYAGYMIVGEELHPLPIGSTLDSRTGTFSWMPGPGFLGTYEFLFLQTDESGITRRIPVKVTIRPKFEKH